LKLTPAAVSIQLKKLEQEVGVKLFDRYPNKLVLTAKGRVFANEVKQIFATLDRAVASISQRSGDYPVKISLSLANDASRFFIPRIGSLIQRKPHLRIAILLRSSSETLSLVQSGEIDFGIGRYRKIPAGIQRLRLFDDRILLIFPLENPPPWIHPVRLQELAKCRLFLLTRASTTRKLIDASLMSKNINLDDIIEVSTCQAGIEFVRLGLGVGLFHKICVSAAADKDLGLIDMSKFFGRSEVSLIYRSRMHLSLAHHQVMTALSTNKADIPE
jgi:DNA-binding transcriptional LysR family regulator